MANPKDSLNFSFIPNADVRISRRIPFENMFEIEIITKMNKRKKVLKVNAKEKRVLKSER